MFSFLSHHFLILISYSFDLNINETSRIIISYNLDIMDRIFHDNIIYLPYHL